MTMTPEQLCALLQLLANMQRQIQYFVDENSKLQQQVNELQSLLNELKEEGE